MPNNKTHVVGGIVSFVVMFLILSQITSLAFPIIFIGLIVAIIYSLLPDIDTDVSTANNVMEKLLVAIGLISSIYYYFFSDPIALLVVIFIFIWLFFLKVLVKHRGIIHTIEAGAVFSLLLLYYSPWLFWFAFAGFLSHLLLDGELKSFSWKEIKKRL